MNFVSDFGEALNAYSDVYVYGAAIIVALIALMIFKFIFRGAVTKRVHNLEGDGSAFMSLDKMRKMGQITEDEYKLMRKRLAEQQLQEMQERDSSVEAAELLAALQNNPEAALKNLPAASPRVRQSLAGLGKPQPDAPDIGEWDKATSSPRPLPTLPKPELPDHWPSPSTLPEEPDLRDLTADEMEQIVPGDPLSDPRMSGSFAEAEEAKAASPKPDGELEQLLLRGVITPEDYKRLTAALDK